MSMQRHPKKDKLENIIEISLLLTHQRLREWVLFLPVARPQCQMYSILWLISKSSASQIDVQYPELSIGHDPIENLRKEMGVPRVESGFS